MRFSVVMASYLGAYQNAAARRDEKIVRAIQSVLDQTFNDFEIWVIADGCQQTVYIVSKFTDERVNIKLIDKRPFWDGEPRNTGIESARGELIVYIDNDDFYGENHLQHIDNHFGNSDWVYYNDWMYNSNGTWHSRHCDIRKIGQNGTSNVCHKRSLNARWGYRGYAHDHYFNQKLLFYSNHKKIPPGEYFVCHMPGYYDI